VSICDIIFIKLPSNYVPNFINIATAKFISPGGLGNPKNAKKRVFLRVFCPYDFRPRYLGQFQPLPDVLGRRLSEAKLAVEEECAPLLTTKYVFSRFGGVRDPQAIGIWL